MDPLPDRVVGVEGNCFAVTFPYPRDMALTVALKGAVAQRSFKPNPNRWLVPMVPGAAHDLAAFADKYRFTVRPAAREQLARHGSGPRPADRRMSLVPTTGDVEVSFCNLTPAEFGMLLAQVKEIAGPGGWRPINRSWHIQINARTTDRLRVLAQQWRFHVDAAVAARIGLQEDDTPVEDQNDDELRKKLEQFVSTKGDRLMPFQEECALYVHGRRRVYLGDDVGLGKTVQTLASAWLADAFPLVVVCQSDLKIKWTREVWRWLPGKRVQLVKGSRDAIRRADVVVLNHEILHYYVDAIRRIQPKMVAIDEAHKLKTMTAKRTKAGLQICEGVDYRMLLSATPMPNRPQELRAPLTTLGIMERFGGWQTFSRRYCRAQRKTVLVWDQARGRKVQRTIVDTSGSANETELHRRLVDMCFLRRTKAQVLDQLPDKVYATVPVEIENRAEYDAARESFLEWLAEQARGDAKVLAALPADMTDDERAEAIELHVDARVEKTMQMEAQQRMAALKRLAEKGKLPHVIRWVRAFLDDTPGKIYLSAYSRDVQQQLIDAFPGCARIHADDSLRVRQENVDRFQLVDDCRVLVASLIAGQTGHDLTAAMDMAHVGLGWRPLDYDQMEGRAWGRMNDLHGLNVHFLVAADTVEEDILELVARKRKRVDAVVDGKKVKDDDDTVFDAVLSRMRVRATREKESR